MRCDEMHTVYKLCIFLLLSITQGKNVKVCLKCDCLLLTSQSSPFRNIVHTTVTSLSLCDTDDGYLEFENKQDNRFTCRDIPPTSNVTWTLIDNQGYVRNLGTCPPPASSQQSTCNASSIGGAFTSNRTSGDTSFIMFNATATWANPNSTGKLNLQCTTGTEQVTCPLDYIYKTSNEGFVCKVQFTNNPWAVSGQCNITKTFSVRGRYRCLIYEQNQKQEERLIHNASMSTTSTGQDQVSGNCKFHSSLPPDGYYNYKAVIIPGNVSLSAVFTGSNEIRTPSSRPSHNCPEIAQEGQDIQCSCSVSDYGVPSGKLQWNNTGSTQLSLTDVTRKENEMQFACRLTWNNTDTWSVNYTLIVTYPPVIMDFKVNSINMNVTVNESSPVTLSCEANSRPLPRTSLINPSNEVFSTVPVGDITTSDVVRQLNYTFLNVSCEDSGNYRCDVDNGVGKDNKSIMLLVQCAPRAASDKQSIVFVDKKVQLQFNLTAYPSPKVVNVTLRPMEMKVQESLVSANCTPVKYQLALFICTVTIMNMTSADAGNYRVTVRNSLGQLELMFEVKLDNTGRPETAHRDQSGFIGAIIGGIIGGIIVIAITGVLVFCLRRKGSAVSKQHQEPQDNKIAENRSEEYATVNKKRSKTNGAQKNTKAKPKETPAQALSMCPMTGTEYENCALEENQVEEKTKSAKEIRRRKEKELNYTTVIFSDAETARSPPSKTETTEYACIAAQNESKKD